MGYWRLVFRRAFQSTRKHLKIDTLPSILVLLAVQIASAGVLWLLTGNANLPTRFATAAAPFLLVVPVFLIVLFFTPGEMHDELSAKLRPNGASNREIRIQLATFAKEIEELANALPPLGDAEIEELLSAWHEKVVSYLSEAADISYVQIFESDAGFQGMMIMNSPLRKTQQQALNYLRFRQQRIDQLISKFQD